MLRVRADVDVVVGEKMYPFIWSREDVSLRWDQIEPLLERSVAHSKGTLNMEQIKDILLTNQGVVIGTMRKEEVIFLCVVHLVGYSDYAVARVIAAAGSEIKETMKHLDVLEVWAFSQGAVEIEAWCRPSMVRLLRRWKFQPKFTMVSLDLRRKLQ